MGKCIFKHKWVYSNIKEMRGFYEKNEKKIIHFKRFTERVCSRCGQKEIVEDWVFDTSFGGQACRLKWRRIK